MMDTRFRITLAYAVLIGKGINHPRVSILGRVEAGLPLEWIVAQVKEAAECHYQSGGQRGSVSVLLPDDQELAGAIARALSIMADPPFILVSRQSIGGETHALAAFLPEQAWTELSGQLSQFPFDGMSIPDWLNEVAC